MDFQENMSVEERLSLAKSCGALDGHQKRREALEEGTWRAHHSSDWDSDLINAVGNRGAREVFGLAGDLSPSEDPVYRDCLEAYNRAAIAAWDAAAD